MDNMKKDLKQCISKNGIMTDLPHPGMGFAYADTKESDFKTYCKSVETNDIEDFISDFEDMVEMHEDNAREHEKAKKVIDFVKKNHFVNIGSDYGGDYWFYCKETNMIYTLEHEDCITFLSTATSFSSIKSEGKNLLKRERDYIEADKAIGENRLQ